MSEAFSRLKETLRQPGNQRTEEDLNLVQNYTRHIEFFAKLNEEQGNEELHRACCRVMEFQYFYGGQFIFKYGEQGDFFCIILRGSVALLQPKKKKRPTEEAAGNTAEASEEHSEAGSESHKQTQELPGELPTQETVVESEEEKFSKLAELHAGASFGELAILKDLPRSATAQCLDDTSLAVIKAADFNKILAAYEEKKLTKKVEFLSSLPFLRNWTKVALYKLTYFFKERSYKFNQFVYKEGSPANEVFVIRSGEFKFSKQSSSLQTKPLDLTTLTTVNQASARRMLKEHKQTKEEKLWMMIKGPLEMFGDYDVIENTPRQQTCICSTRKADVYVISKIDFMKRMGSSYTWANIKRRHNIEAQWLISREETLKILSQRQQTPEPIKKTPEPESTIRYFLRPSTAQATYRPSSTEPGDSFFKTQIEDLDVSRISLKRSTPDTSMSIKRKMSVSAPKMPRSKSALRAKNRPPPTFFGSAKEALKKKYAIRTKIIEEPKLPDRNLKEELRAKIIRVMTARAEEQSKRLTPSRHNLFRRA
mmetsp:Transcript_4190/g.8406  ORF Transcript_4190/g.8406 Transcript_4190/m.8406 type:complete len:537 (+) Transcript_4190:1328-2938(+)